MPDFELAPTAGVAVQLATVDVRANPCASKPQRIFAGSVGTQITVTATRNGAVGPSDASIYPLEPWVPLLTEWSGATPDVTSPAGYSSIQSFTPAAPGHYTLVMSRAGGGAVGIMFEVF